MVAVDTVRAVGREITMVAMKHILAAVTVLGFDTLVALFAIVAVETIHTKVALKNTTRVQASLTLTSLKSQVTILESARFIAVVAIGHTRLMGRPSRHRHTVF